MRTWLGFLAINLLPEKPPDYNLARGFTPFVGSDFDDSFLCPVRDLRTYLKRVKQKRKGRKRLLLPVRGSQNM